jgi:hypothetical protein
LRKRHSIRFYTGNFNAASFIEKLKGFRAPPPVAGIPCS